MTNTSFEGHIITAFKKEADAERYYQTLISHGYAQDEISIFMSEATKKKFEESDLNTTPSAAAAVGTGSAIGGSIGAIAGAILALGTNAVVPGLGIVIAGPLLAGLAGAGAGGVTGGVVGLLSRIGIGEDYAQTYQEAIDDGNVVIAVDPKPEHVSVIKEQIDHNNGEKVYCAKE